MTPKPIPDPIPDSALVVKHPTLPLRDRLTVLFRGTCTAIENSVNEEAILAYRFGSNLAREEYLARRRTYDQRYREKKKQRLLQSQEPPTAAEDALQHDPEAADPTLL